MSAPTIQAFDQRHPTIVEPSEIRPGDFMRDLGTLRRVESVETPADTRSVSVRFEGGIDGLYGTLSVPGDVPVTVWRTPPPQGSESRSEAASDADA